VYYGRVYYWMNDLSILPVHFSEYELYVEESEWYEPGGGIYSAGGYPKTSKRYRTPHAGKKVMLSTDFKPALQKEWHGGTVHIPDCIVYRDYQTKWW
jgi:competence protein CoiA